MRVLCVLLFFLLSAAPAFAEDNLTVLTHNSRGQTYLDDKGEMRGAEHAGKRAFYVEVVRELMLQVGLKPVMKDVAFKEGFNLAKTKPGIVFFNVSRTPARENLFKWVGPLEKEIDFLFASSKRRSPVKTIVEAKAVSKICVLDGGVHQAALTKKGFTNLVAAKSYAECFKLLHEAKVDLTPSASRSVGKKLARAGLPANAAVNTNIMVAESCGCIAFSKSTPDSVIQQWQTALVRLVSSGAYEQLYNKYYLPAK